MSDIKALAARVSSRISELQTALDAETTRNRQREQTGDRSCEKMLRLQGNIGSLEWVIRLLEGTDV